MDNRHAYLIMIHKIDNQLYALLRMIDDSRNDIYLHIDKKCEVENVDDLRNTLKCSTLTITPRVSVTWGGYSQIEAELILLKSATEKRIYQYYHLISGQDLPIKTQNYIHKFFDNNDGKQFIGFSKLSTKFSDRYSYYYLLQDIVGRGNRITRILERLSIGIQRIIRINRSNKNINITFCKGPNWFSITDEFARYIISKEKWIKESFQKTKWCDEVFVQTLASNSEFSSQIYDRSNQDDNAAAMRLIDWKRGNPYVFRSSDLKELQSSRMIFARKFDCNIDNMIINEISNSCLKEEKS